MSANVTTAAGGDADNPVKIPLFLQTKEEATALQVGVVLNVVHVMRSLLVIADEETASRLDGEARIAAQSTLIRACGRIDDILGEGDRWSVSNHKELNKAILDVHKTQERMLKANLNYIDNAQRPSTRLRPTLASHGLGHFIAFWGSLEKPGMAIVGRGRTPYEALKDFDAAFHRTPAEQIQVINDLFEGPPPIDAEEIPPTEENPPNES